MVMSCWALMWSDELEDGGEGGGLLDWGDIDGSAATSASTCKLACNDMLLDAEVVSELELDLPLLVMSLSELSESESKAAGPLNVGLAGSDRGGSERDAVTDCNCSSSSSSDSDSDSVSEDG